jgi:hypothetical protein
MRMPMPAAVTTIFRSEREMPTPITWIPFDQIPAGKIKRGPHAMTGRMKRLPWPYCRRCGLIALKNDATRAALKRECVTVED